MKEEIIVYRFGKVGDDIASEIKVEDDIASKIMKYHFNHLKENGTLLFTTSSTIKTADQKGHTIVFTDKKRSFRATIVDSGKFKEKSPKDEFQVPKQFEPRLEKERNEGYKWFAVEAEKENLKLESFEKGKYRLARADVDVDVYDSLGKNQTPYRYVVPIHKQ